MFLFIILSSEPIIWTSISEERMTSEQSLNMLVTWISYFVHNYLYYDETGWNETKDVSTL